MTTYITHNYRKVLTLLLTLVVGAIASLPADAEIYIWQDEQGNSVYSDQPHKNAKKVELPPLPTIPGFIPSTTPATTTDKQQPVIQYHSLAITKPVNDEAQWLPTGEVDVVIEMDPPLAVTYGHYLSIKLDGQESIARTLESAIKLTNIFRGTHTVTAIIHDQNGAVVKQSPTITFHIHRR